jgi:hypothetical protein
MYFHKEEEEEEKAHSDHKGDSKNDPYLLRPRSGPMGCRQPHSWSTRQFGEVQNWVGESIIQMQRFTSLNTSKRVRATFSSPGLHQAIVPQSKPDFMGWKRKAPHQAHSMKGLIVL